MERPGGAVAVGAIASAPEQAATDIAALIDALRRAERPLILVVADTAARAAEAFRSFSATLGVPSSARCWVSTCCGRDPLRVGMIGSYGTLGEPGHRPGDLLIVLGSRLDIRQTGAMADAFKGDRSSSTSIATKRRSTTGFGAVFRSSPSSGRFSRRH